MKKSLFLAALLLVAVSGFAQVSVNNFNGYSDYWHPFGYPNTATYGELFTAPGSVSNLSSFSFYMGDPVLSRQHHHRRLHCDVEWQRRPVTLLYRPPRTDL